jgi:sulfur-carrier protein
MISVWIHTNIARFGSGETEFTFTTDAESTLVKDILAKIFQNDSKTLFAIIDETGKIRQHINIFVGNKNIKRIQGLDTKVNAEDEISIFPAVSGG